MISPTMASLLHCWLATAILIVTSVALTTCPNPSKADYDFIIVGSGAGGGPLAARLSESGYSGMSFCSHVDCFSCYSLVLLVDAGHDVVNFNTSIPLYFIRSLEGESDTFILAVDTYIANFKILKSNLTTLFKSSPPDFLYGETTVGERELRPI